MPAKKQSTEEALDTLFPPGVTTDADGVITDGVAVAEDGTITAHSTGEVIGVDPTVENPVWPVDLHAENSPTLEERLTELSGNIDANKREFREAMIECRFLAEQYGKAAQQLNEKDFVNHFQRLFERADEAITAVK